MGEARLDRGGGRGAAPVERKSGPDRLSRFPQGPEPGSRALRVHRRRRGIVRPARRSMPPNTATAQRMHDVAGYDSLLHRDTVAMLRDIDVGDPAPKANGNMMFIKPSADPRKLADAGVTECLVAQTAAAVRRSAGRRRRRLKYRLAGHRARGRPFRPCRDRRGRVRPHGASGRRPRRARRERSQDDGLVGGDRRPAGDVGGLPMAGSRTAGRASHRFCSGICLRASQPGCVMVHCGARDSDRNLHRRPTRAAGF